MNQTQAGIFAGSPDARIFWMDDDCQFATRGDPVEWLALYNEPKPAEGIRNKPWQAIGARPDAPALRTLSWDPAHPRAFMNLYKASPFGQGAEFDFATELISRERLGQSTTTDFLCVISSSTELLGYETGARSPLMEQMIMHVDRRIEALIAQLAKVTGETGFNLVVCGAHGVPPEPPAELRDRMAVPGERIAQAIERYLISGTGGHVEKYLYPFLYLDTEGFRDPDPIRIAAARAALRQPGVSGYYTAAGVCSVGGEWERRFRASFHPDRSGDVMLSYAPEYVEDFGQGRGVSYGSLYNYDVKVPLFLYGPSFKAGNFEQPIELVDVAPTLARVLGVAEGSSSCGRVLGEALA
jgi:predicted AlkP superfamily pyrophosphatase or phosphodiesterase